jgi:hypothetical protein
MMVIRGANANCATRLTEQLTSCRRFKKLTKVMRTANNWAGCSRRRPGLWQVGCAASLEGAGKLQERKEVSDGQR